MSISRTLRDLCAIKQKIRIENTFAYAVYNVIVVKKTCMNIKNLKINGKINKV